MDAVAFWPRSARRGGRVVWRPAAGCVAGVLLRPVQPSTRDRLVVSQAGGGREVTDHCWPGASRPMPGDLAGDGPGLAGERVHGGRAAQARLWRLLGPARARHGGVGGHVWSAPGRAPRHLVSRPPRPPWRVALTPDGRIQRPPQNHSLLVNCCLHDGPDSGFPHAPRRANHAKGDAFPCLFLQGCPTRKRTAACENMTFSWTPFWRTGNQHSAPSLGANSVR
jgi:hypothetical protein